ncbi:MAG: hypothetical protein GX989_04520 [Firmicutes bacterium]|nr:hypothetical protein [Bacillota bacterium]
MSVKRVRQFTVYLFTFIILGTILAAGCGNDVPKGVAAKVNGEYIEKKDVENFLKMVYLFSGPDAEEAYAEEEAALEERILWFLIENKVVQQEVERLDLIADIDENKVSSGYEQVKKELIENIYGSEEEYSLRLNELKIDEEDLRDFHLKAYYTELLYEYKSKEISEEDARAFVEENPLLLKKPAQVHVYHILLEDEEKAQEVRQLLVEGADFVETGEEHSLDSHVELGLIGAGDPFDPTFLEAAFDLDPGEISQPVETTFGYHLIKITEKKEEEELTFEDVRDKALDVKRQEHFHQYFQKLVEGADIDTFDQKSSEEQMHKTPFQDK